MLIKINRTDCLNAFAVFPLRNYNYEKEEEEIYYPAVFKSYLLTVSSRSFRSHVMAMGKQLAKMTEFFNIDSLIFLGDTDRPWQYRNIEYKAAREAKLYLTSNKIGKKFNGALQVDRTALPVFIRHLSWLTRCNAALPYIHFTDAEQQLLGHICQYGNLHFHSLDEKMDSALQAYIAQSRFIYVADNKCHNQFSNNSITG
ncbi:hypothetical protein [Deminuibacter soli]|uniref:Uncharacterized protein n=1 Tax=Deminuibacter soli TaxID=2291815 RepID=A0A3E1NG18_9BACT|nr:hypothetical protein [Deminuibacter soli]RFM26822.1 hypothetical protein DXN05_17695 [Deminuibacter soli]